MGFLTMVLNYITLVNLIIWLKNLVKLLVSNFLVNFSLSLHW